MRVDDLARDGLANPNMAGDAAILRFGRRAGEMLLAICVTAEAEVCPLNGAEIEAVLVVVTRRAQTTAQRPRRRIANETSRRLGWGGESVVAKRRPCRAIVVQRALKSGGEVFAGQGLLVLGLMAAAALAIVHRLGEIGVAVGYVALPATDARRRVTTLEIARADRPRVTGDAVFDIRGRTRYGCRVRPRRLRDQKAATDRKRKRDDSDGQLGTALPHNRT
jgi:hypothetical protein